jgi:hypothetical protein
VVWTTERALVYPRWRDPGLFRTVSVAAHGKEYPRPETGFASPPRSPAWPWQGYCKMQDATAVQVTIYFHEADQCYHRPLHMEILNYLWRENVFAATVLHTVAGFGGRHRD